MAATGNKFANLKSGVQNLVSKFRENCEGVAALEFALIAPIMIMLFVGTLEVSAAVSVNRKVSRISSVVGDLVTQSTDLSSSDIANIMSVSTDIMEPYSNSVKIRLTGITIAGGVATVSWGCNQGWTSVADGSVYTVPTAIKIDGTFLVAARVQTTYQPMVGWARYSESAGISFDNTSVTMDEEIFLRPRIGSSVKVVNC
ncbi:MAG: pilus assembly protein [Hyphomicrobiales bacterium]|nr:pilus assembly protein [Hyphomicrobiales bacterium]